MVTTLEELFDLYLLPCGRAVYAAHGAVAVAARDSAELAQWAQAYLDAARTAHDLEQRHRLATGLPQYGPRAAALDADFDHAMGQLHAAIAVYVGLERDPVVDAALVRAAQRLSRELFPRGVAHLTTRSFVEELIDGQALLARLTGAGDLVAEVGQLGLAPFVARLARVTQAFAAEVAAAPKAEGPRWDAVRAARAAAHRAQLRYVGAVIGATLADDDASAARRTALLEPVMTQERALAALYKARRAVTDVDPDDVEPATTPSAGGGAAPA